MPEELEAVELGGGRSTSLARSLTSRSSETLQQCAALLLYSDSPYVGCVAPWPDAPVNSAAKQDAALLPTVVLQMFGGSMCPPCAAHARPRSGECSSSASLCTFLCGSAVVCHEQLPPKFAYVTDCYQVQPCTALLPCKCLLSIYPAVSQTMWCSVLGVQNERRPAFLASQATG